MLTIKDLKLIGELLDKRFFGFSKEVDGKFISFEEKFNNKFISFNEHVDAKFDEFAILMQQEFRHIHGRIDNVEEKLDEKADKTDITRLENNLIRIENKFDARIDRADDNIRIIKTKLKLS